MIKELPIVFHPDRLCDPEHDPIEAIEKSIQGVEQLNRSQKRQKRQTWSTMLSISQDNKYYKLFQVFLTLIVAFSSCLYANFACFRYDVEGDVHDNDPSK